MYIITHNSTGSLYPYIYVRYHQFYIMSVLIMRTLCDEMQYNTPLSHDNIYNTSFLGNISSVSSSRTIQYPINYLATPFRLFYTPYETKTVAFCMS